MTPEHILVARAQRGDTEAFAQIYDQNVDAIYRYVRLRVPTNEEAEDITEDVFLRAWEKLGSYRPKRPFRNWLYRIAQHRIIDVHRRQPQSPASLDALADLEMSPADSSPDPLQRALVGQDIQDLQQALATLKPDEQAVLTLRFTENMNFQDIGNILKKSAGACRILQHRALKKLARQLTATGEVNA